MGRPRNPERENSKVRYLQSGGKITTKELAMAADVSEVQIRKWKSSDNWEEELKKIRKKGGQKGNTNAAGHGAPAGNKNAVTHGAFKQVGFDDISPEDAEAIQGLSLNSQSNMLGELQALMLRKTYLETQLMEYTRKDNTQLYTDKVVHMVVPKSVEERMQEQAAGLEEEEAEDPEQEQSNEILKTAMKTIIKASPFDRAMKVEAELSKVHGRIIKLLDSIKSYELEERRLTLEEKKYKLAKQRITGEFNIDPETGEIVDDETDDFPEND